MKKILAVLLLCFLSSQGFAGTLYPNFPETFESARKTAYQFGSVTLPSGTWELKNALLGACTDDVKDGLQSVRLADTGTLTLTAGLTAGAGTVTIAAGSFGNDADALWQLWFSTDNGTTWTQSGGTITTSATSLTTTTFNPLAAGNVRLQVRKISGGRLNIDDIRVWSYDVSAATDTIPTRDNNMALGNPDNALSDPSDSSHYLLVRAQYALSYNNHKGMANWVSWHLSTAWMGPAPRCNCFTSDGALPAGYFRATTSLYTGSGFDRGHLCPSEDRTASDTDNANTFKMSNISPQAPIMNEVTWAALESYCRTLAGQGNELYIIAGGYGTGGSGSTGGTTSSIDAGAITVPAHFWKVIVILPVGTNDVSRITTSTRVIAVDMPNVQGVSAHSWDYYRTTVDSIETSTGFDLLSNVPTPIQAVLESVVDSGPTS
jgi:endonuclease G, mitochondrial